MRARRPAVAAAVAHAARAPQHLRPHRPRAPASGSMSSGALASGSDARMPSCPETEHPPPNARVRSQSLMVFRPIVHGKVNPLLSALVAGKDARVIRSEVAKIEAITNRKGKKKALLTTKVWLDSGKWYTILSRVSLLHLEQVDE